MIKRYTFVYTHQKWVAVKRTFLLFICSLIIGSCTEQDVDPGGTTTTTSSPAVTKSPPTNTSPSTTFISNQCHSMNALGDWWVQEFTLSGSRRLVMRFSSRYAADAAIITPDQLNNFKNNASFSGFGSFDNKFGYQTVTLSSGTYYAAMRNQISGANVVTMELDYDIELPASDKATFYDIYISGVETLNPGAKLWHSFTIQSDVRYFIDGGNTGLDCYFIPESELENFKNDRTFTYYVDYSGTSCNLPGLDEIKLPVGNYYMVFRNKQSVPNTVNYFMERWRVNG